MKPNKSKKRTIRSLLCFLLACWMAVPLQLAVAAQSVFFQAPQPDSKKIALTFDDGPHPRQTQKILDILDRYHVKATFFMVGTNVEYFTDVAKDVISRGHQVGNHSYTHPHLKNKSEEAVREEIEQCERALRERCGYRPTVLRPPEGVLGEAVRQAAIKKGYRIILWNEDTRDWADQNPRRIAQYVLSNVKAGDIILMHDSVLNSKTPEALELLLPKLLALGFEPVTVDELLNCGE